MHKVKEQKTKYAVLVAVISIDPPQEEHSCSREDNTNYLSQSQLGPGIRVESSVATDDGPYATCSRASAFVLLRNTTGLTRVTVACHGFPKANAVYHPINPQHRIGEVHERMQAYDLELIEIAPSAEFTNNPTSRLSIRNACFSIMSCSMVNGPWQMECLQGSSS